jgi:hypothetical protein
MYGSETFLKFRKFEKDSMRQRVNVRQRIKLRDIESVSDCEVRSAETAGMKLSSKVREFCLICSDRCV